MNVGESRGGLPPDSLVEDEQFILRDSQRSIEQYHDNSRHAMTRMTPGQYAESLGWVGDDVWHAHCVHLDDATIGRFAATGTGDAHCPSSNMLNEARTACLLARVGERNAAAMDPRTALEIATHGGARVLGRDTAEIETFVERVNTASQAMAVRVG